MPQITAVFLNHTDAATAQTFEHLDASEVVAEILLLGDGAATNRSAKARGLALELLSGASIAQLLDAATGDYLLVILPGERVHLGQRALERMLAVAGDTGAAWVYADFREEDNGAIQDHPLIDYQPGSIRDNFDFGSLILIDRRAALEALARHGAIPEKLRWGGLYDLRLKLSLDHRIQRIAEPLYTRLRRDPRASGEKQFDYVDPRNRDYQIEMEEVATAHLKRAGAWLAPPSERLPEPDSAYPLKASVIIPVRNRERTIADAVRSALSQEADFDFNVIVVDNHSTDRTKEILLELAKNDARLVHLIPERTDLGIGGCWNEAVYSEACGLYAVQLDSDDLYAGKDTLARIVAKFAEGPYAMVIGSYTIVDFELREIPPGLIDHREWTRENGHNNALRINGLGAPRAFYVPVLRRIGLPNVSYGEDYAAALRISRQYEIGRIYESIYYARRWEGNSDAALPLATANRYDAYKDFLRSVEINARRRLNGR